MATDIQLTEIQLNALRRYAALAEGIESLTGDALKQAHADRAEHADEYTIGDHCALARPGLMVRFLCEVCDLPQRDARACVIAFLRYSGLGRIGPDADADARDLALEVLTHTGNIFAAEAAAALICEAAEGTKSARVWESVLDILRNRPLVQTGESVH